MWKTCLTLLSGVAAATAFFVACSDDSPGNADAADCNCPAAEPPIATRIMRVQGDLLTVPAQTNRATAATCPDGAMLLSGSCQQDSLDVETFLISAGADVEPGTPTAWLCEWSNRRPAGDVTVRAHAVCLMPE
jgi:hypothetical protein